MFGLIENIKQGRKMKKRKRKENKWKRKYKFFVLLFFGWEKNKRENIKKIN